MKVISLGLGRTGTNSLRLALNQLGLGPCHHMVEVLSDRETHTPLWEAAVAGRADWSAIFDGYESAVDWPTAGFARELVAAYPDAKFLLSIRSTESWVNSFSETIYTSLAAPEKLPPEMHRWHNMVVSVIEKTGIPMGLDKDTLAERFEAHNAMVRSLLPADRLLEFEARDGWEPLCDYLGVPVPEGDYPRTNSRVEFWEIMNSKTP